MKGILPDYFRRLAEQAGLSYQFVRCETRDDYISHQQDSDVDLIIDARIPDENWAEARDIAASAPYITMRTAMVTRRDFSGEIKTVATVNQSNSGNLEDSYTPDAEKLHADILKVQTSSNHLLSLINDVLDMSRIESGEVTLNQEQIILADQVGQIDSIIRPQVLEKGQTLTIRVHEIAHEYLIGDAVRLRQVLINLLSNAMKYTPKGGDIRFDLAELACDKPETAKFSFTVTDTGYGMAPELMKHIFEPFTRAENSVTNKVQGTGLVLAITKNNVDLMGGAINVRSQVGQGSQFTVTLEFPIDPNRKPQVVNQSYSELEASRAEKGAMLRGMRFLCAEDNALNAEILQALLDMSGASCTFYPNGRELVEAFQSVKPGDYDAILMDIQMPVMNGLDATAAIRNGSNPLGKTIPIIAMTANAFSEDVKDCLDAGMDAHVAKPLDIAVLERALRSLLSRGFQSKG